MADCSSQRQMSYQALSKCSENLSLRRVLLALQQQDGFERHSHNDHLETSFESSRGMRNVSTLRATDIALKNASAYREQSNVKVQQHQCPRNTLSSSMESILKKKVFHSQKKWRNSSTEEIRYYKMWRSLSRDVQERSTRNRLIREQAFRSSRNRSNKDLMKEKSTSLFESLSTSFSEGRSAKQHKNLIPSLRRQNASQQVLPRIVLPL